MNVHDVGDIRYADDDHQQGRAKQSARPAANDPRQAGRFLSSVVSPGEFQAALAASQAAWVAHRDLSCAFQSKFAAEFRQLGCGWLEMQSVQCMTRMNQRAAFGELAAQLQRLMGLRADPAIRSYHPAPDRPRHAARNDTIGAGHAGRSRSSQAGQLFSGDDANGRAYSGTCMITALGGGQYKFEWRAGGIYVGTGKLEGDDIRQLGQQCAGDLQGQCRRHALRNLGQWPRHGVPEAGLLGGQTPQAAAGFHPAAAMSRWIDHLADHRVPAPCSGIGLLRLSDSGSTRAACTSRTPAQPGRRRTRRRRRPPSPSRPYGSRRGERARMNSVLVTPP